MWTRSPPNIQKWKENNTNPYEEIATPQKAPIAKDHSDANKDTYPAHGESEIRLSKYPCISLGPNTP